MRVEFKPRARGSNRKGERGKMARDLKEETRHAEMRRVERGGKEWSLDRRNC